MTIPEPVQTTATVLARGGFYLGSLWVMATAAVIIDRRIGEARRAKAKAARDAALDRGLDLVGIPSGGSTGIRRALDHAASREAQR